MGQTLTHGVYLPDEGERNCYNGLASNWSILDGAVGTIAEHTTALAGKAPAVHTHTKAGVTDLLNSNFIPSANNSYDLGSSSYQWNNVYSKNYFYNGTEFQSKFVTLDTDQTLTGRKNYKTSYSDILPKTVNFPSATRYYVAQRDYAYNDESLTLTWGFVQSSGTNVRRWYVYPYSSGDSVYFQISINADASSSEFKTNVKSVIPVTNNTTDLGTSTNKWKTLNGVNPGALSLPDYDHPTFLDVSADGLNWYKNTTPNFYTMPVDGYFVVITQNPSISNAVLDIWVNNTGMGSSSHGTYTGSELFCYVPARANQVIRVRARCDNYYSVAIYPAQGNV